jgi:predicted nucleic acid-binding protein
VRTTEVRHADISSRNLDPGEQAAIALAVELHADLLLLIFF